MRDISCGLSPGKASLGPGLSHPGSLWARRRGCPSRVLISSSGPGTGSLLIGLFPSLSPQNEQFQANSGRFFIHPSQPHVLIPRILLLVGVKGPAQGMKLCPTAEGMSWAQPHSQPFPEKQELLEDPNLLNTLLPALRKTFYVGEKVRKMQIFLLSLADQNFIPN